LRRCDRSGSIVVLYRDRRSTPNRVCFRVVPRSGWRSHALAMVAVSALVGATAICKVWDPDVFWHVKTGEWIWTHHAVPTRDYFSYTAPGPLAYTEALAQLFLYALDRAGGASALTMGAALLAFAYACAVFLLCGVDRDRTPAARLLASAGVALASSYRFGPKTELFSFIAQALLVSLVLAFEREAERPDGPARRQLLRWLGAIAVLCVVWANCHRGGVLAPVTLAVAAGAWALRGKTRPLAVPGLVGAGVAAAALMLQPSGARYFSSSVGLTSRTSLGASLPEFRPADLAFLTRVDPWALVLLATWLATLAWRRRFDAETAIALMSLVMPWVSVRYVPFAALALGPGVARGIDGAARWVAGRFEQPVSALQASALAFALSGGALGYQYVTGHAPDAFGSGLLTWRVPVGAATFLRAHPPPGRMWNSFDFGGYLAYALGPEQKVFIDGRNDTVYPRAFYDETQMASVDFATLRRQFERYGVTYAVLLCSGLRERRFAQLYADPRWRLVYVDDVAAVLVRRTPQSEPLVAMYGYTVLDPVTAVDKVATLPSAPQAWRAAFESEAERALLEASDSARAHVVWAGVLLARGDAGGAHAQADVAREIASARGITLDLSL
jgi:hypothetical protein